MPASTKFFDIAAGTSGLEVFSLPLNGTLLFAAVSMHTAAGGPARVSLAMQYQNDTANRGPIGNGPKWLRSTASFGVQDSVEWNGEIPLAKIRNSILVLWRNDTAAVQALRLSYVWRPA